MKDVYIKTKDNQNFEFGSYDPRNGRRRSLLSFHKRGDNKWLVICNELKKELFTKLLGAPQGSKKNVFTHMGNCALAQTIYRWFVTTNQLNDLMNWLIANS